jgi:transglutaminase-like putative cysteine protease
MIGRGASCTTRETQPMHIRVGYEIVYDCPQDTPMIFMLHVHYSRASDLVVPDHLTTYPSVPISAYRDSFGNWCSRIVAPPGQIRVASTAVVRDTGLPDVILPNAQQHRVQDLPEETLMYLCGSRYCETDKLSDIAWNLFGNTPPGWARVHAISSFVHHHIKFGYEYARNTRTAFEAYNEGVGVCRDFAHLAGGRADGFRRLVRSVSGRRLAHLRPAQLHPPHRPRGDRAWPRRGGRAHLPHLRRLQPAQLPGLDG